MLKGRAQLDRARAGSRGPEDAVGALSFHDNMFLPVALRRCRVPVQRLREACTGGQLKRNKVVAFLKGTLYGQ